MVWIQNTGSHTCHINNVAQFIPKPDPYNTLQDWASDIKLFESGVRVNPNNVKLHNNYGMELKAAGRIQEARNQYKVLRISYLVLYTLIEDDYVTNVAIIYAVGYGD